MENGGDGSIDLEQGDGNLVDKRLWNRIWHSCVHSKVKVFGWKLVRDYLPVFRNLWQRKLDIQTICPKCGVSEETILHVMQICAYAKEVWRLSELDAVWSRDGIVDTRDWVLVAACELNQSKFERGLMNTSKLNKSIKRSVSKCKVQWQKPKVNFVKVNFDEAIKATEDIGGTGAIIRDEECLVLGSCSMCHYGILDPLVIEAMTVVKAISFAADMGFHNVIFEGDALKVINLLNSPMDDLSHIGNLIIDGRMKMKAFRAAEIKHIKRDANFDADLLAKYALVNKSNMYCMEECPSFIEELVNNECNNS
ncbi:hypothetical protein REPUB_Repub13aG0155000 [Reevesia pubescens]